MKSIRFFLYTLLLLLTAQWAVAQTEVQQYEYWLDNDYAQREVARNSRVPETITMDVSKVASGLHYFNFRAQTPSGEWGALSRFMVYLSDNGADSKAMAGYEYWLDSDYANRKAVAGNNMAETITMDVSKLSSGLHYFNFRAQTLSGEWGALSRYMVYLSDNGTGSKAIVGSEYWMDNDYANRKVVAGSNVSSPITIDVSNLSSGLHYFNFRAQTQSGEWGALSRYMVYLSDNGSGSKAVAGYEYWMDNDYEGRTKVDGNTMPEAITIDISNLSSGLHYFNYRARTQSGEWGALSRYMVYIQNRSAANAQLKKVEYWIDEQSEQRLSQEVASDSIVIIVDLSDVEIGTHSFNLLGQTVSGEWCMPTSYEFTLGDLPTLPTPVITHEGNIITISDPAIGEDLTSKVEVESGAWDGCNGYTATSYAPSIMTEDGRESLMVENYQSNGDTTGDLMQQTIEGLSAGIYRVTLYGDAYYTPDRGFDSDVTEGQMDVAYMFAETSVGRSKTYMPVRIATETDSNSVVVIDVNVGDDGKLTIGLGKDKAGTNWHTIQIKSLTTIVAADVASNVAYHYTLDGTVPTEASPLYEAPFEVTRNTTVKAVGFLYGYHPSAMAELEVDWFKVATPTFMQNGNLLTINCETEGATIYYTIGDGEEQVYSEPFMLTGESTVKAVGKKEGYHDSDAATYHANLMYVPTPVIAHEGNTITISGGEDVEDGSLITYHYTLDGTTPTEESPLYEKPFEVSRNLTVKAVGFRENYTPSAVAELEVDWFKVATPTFMQNGNLLTINCETEGATIYYTIGDGEEQVYSEPFMLTGTATVKAVGKKEGYHDSDAATYRASLMYVPTPVIAHEGNTITISSGEDGSLITLHYTVDGTTPTEESPLYEKPFEVARNLTVKAVGFRENYTPSAVATLDVDWFKVATPTFAQYGNMLSISCETEGATIYYTIGGGEEQLYSGSIRLSDQSVVTAVGRREGYNDSEKATYQPQAVSSNVPDIAYNGRTARITANEDGAVIYYTLDGSSPVDGLDKSSHAIEYSGEFDVESLCVIRAVAVVDSKNVSDENVYSIDYLYNGETAYVRSGNLLSNAFEWCGGMDAIERLAVEGPLSGADLELLKAAPVLAHLDLSGVTLTADRLADDVFSGTGFVSFVSPRSMSSAGGKLFANCPRLATVVWNADVALNDNVFDGVDNPNLLLYVNSATYAPASVTNVVVNGVAENIVLTDKETGNNDFYCLLPFEADNISYTRDFKMQTEVGVSRGWETIALPFTVETITHERNGMLQPFMAAGEGKPFWLLQMSATGLEVATEMEAHQPYVISMPNSATYADEYNQGGLVTFAATHAEIVPAEPNGVEGQGVVLVPTMQKVEKAEDVYAINRNVPYGAYAEGSVFIADYRDVRPFEAYTLHPAGRRGIIALDELLSGSATGIFSMPIQEGADGIIRVYTVSGIMVAEGQRDEVMKRLPKGVYIMNGKKIIQ